MNDIEQHALLAMVVPFILQWMKGSKFFPFISYAGGWMNRIVAAIVAGLLGLGVAFNFNDDTGTLTVTGLTLATLWPAAQHIAFQIMSQHTVYKLVVAPPMSGIMQAQVRDAATVGETKVPATDPPTIPDFPKTT